MRNQGLKLIRGQIQRWLDIRIHGLQYNQNREVRILASLVFLSALANMILVACSPKAGSKSGSDLVSPACLDQDPRNPTLQLLNIAKTFECTAVGKTYYLGLKHTEDLASIKAGRISSLKPVGPFKIEVIDKIPMVSDPEAFGKRGTKIKIHLAERLSNTSSILPADSAIATIWNFDSQDIIQLEYADGSPDTQSIESLMPSQRLQNSLVLMHENPLVANPILGSETKYGYLVADAGKNSVLGFVRSFQETAKVGSENSTSSNDLMKVSSRQTSVGKSGKVSVHSTISFSLTVDSGKQKRSELPVAAIGTERDMLVVVTSDRPDYLIYIYPENFVRDESAAKFLDVNSFSLSRDQNPKASEAKTSDTSGTEVDSFKTMTQVDYTKRLLAEYELSYKSRLNALKEAGYDSSQMDSDACWIPYKLRVRSDRQSAPESILVFNPKNFVFCIGAIAMGAFSWIDPKSFIKISNLRLWFYPDLSSKILAPGIEVNSTGGSAESLIGAFPELSLKHGPSGVLTIESASGVLDFFSRALVYRGDQSPVSLRFKKVSQSGSLYSPTNGNRSYEFVLNFESSADKQSNEKMRITRAKWNLDGTNKDGGEIKDSNKDIFAQVEFGNSLGDGTRIQILGVDADQLNVLFRIKKEDSTDSQTSSGSGFVAPSYLIKRMESISNPPPRIVQPVEPVTRPPELAPAQRGPQPEKRRQPRMR